jgi:hypothetical protein
MMIKLDDEYLHVGFVKNRTRNAIEITKIAGETGSRIQMTSGNIPSNQKQNHKWGRYKNFLSYRID